MTAPRPSSCSESEKPSGCWPTRATTVRPSWITSKHRERSRSCLLNPIVSNNEPTTKNSIANVTASSDASPDSSTSADSPLATKSSNRTSKLLSPSHAPGYTYSYMSILPRCLVQAFDGVILSEGWKRALWDKFFIGAPRRRRQSVERYNIVKRA